MGAGEKVHLSITCIVLSSKPPIGTGSSLRTKMRADWEIKRMGEAGERGWGKVGQWFVLL